MTDTQDLRRTTTLPLAAGAAVDLARGASLGRYVVLDRIGRGGMGVVYTAYDPELDRKVALKILRPGRDGWGGDDESRIRLLREAQALARLSHPNVVAVHDAGSVESEVFVAMEFVAGRTLRAWQREEKPSWNDAVGVFRQAGRGLAAAHQAGLLHRDFKPANVMLGDDGRVRVLDFGLARPLEGAMEPRDDGDSPGSSGSPLSENLTVAGFQPGTPAYMAPEQYRGLAVDERSDQFSFCAALYEALYGELPFAGADPQEYLARLQRGEVREAPAGSSVPAWLRRVVLRGLRSDPDARYPSLPALLEELDRTPRRRRRLAGAAGLAAAGLVALYGYLGPEAKELCRGAELKLAGIWDAPRKSRLREAFLATGLPYAADAWRGSERLLDDFAGRWTAMRTEACEATHLRGEQSDRLLDLRMDCLDDRLRELEATTALLGRADDEVVRNAVRAVSGLTRLGGCADAELLTALVRPPDDEATRLEVDRLRSSLAEISALRDAGLNREALPRAQAAAQESVALGYPPLAAEALFSVARSQHVDAAHAAAVESLIAAAAGAEEGRHHEFRARILIELVWITGFRLRESVAGRRWLDLARGAVRGLGAEHRYELDWHHAAAVFYLAQGDFPRADREATAAFEGRREILGGEHRHTIHALSTLGRVQYGQADYEAALETFQRIADLRRRQLGAEHPQVGAADQALGEILRSLGRYEEAFEPLTRALASMEQSFGPESSEVATVLNSLGGVHFGLEAYGEALVSYERALELRHGIYGEEHSDVAKVVRNLALAYRELGRFDEAESHLRRALKVHEKIDGPEHPSTLRTRDNLAAVEAWRAGHP